MKIKPAHFLIFIFLIFSQYSFAQRNCGTSHLHQQKKTNQPSLYQAQEDYKRQLNQSVQNKSAAKLSGVNDIYSIPVVVHVIYNGTGSTNISDEQVISQIDVLNEDFRKKTGTNGFNTNPVGADVKIEFCLASADPDGNYTTGITRTFHSKASWSANSSDEILLKSLSKWPSDKYLNIWVCKMDNAYLGYAQYPVGSSLTMPSGGTSDIDGVVIDYRAFGRTGVAGTSPHGLYGLGRTTTHEIGHWLGLIHIWGENDSFGCGNDYVTDTPLDKKPNNDANCYDTSDCDGDLIYVQDMTSNYLDYSPDVCMNTFTAGQRDRMRTVMESAPLRMSLLSSPACCISSQPIELPIIEDFESGTLPSTWVKYNPNLGSPEWTTSTPSGYNNGSYSFMIDNDIATPNEIDYFETYYLKFKDAEPVLEFDLAYANNNSSQTDSLIISYSLNCSNWIPVLSLYNNSLLTTSRVTDNFLPLANEWKKIRLDLNDLDFKPVGRIRFENYSKGVNKLYIDNINVYKTALQLSIIPYPHPTDDILNVDVIFPNMEDVKYELFDLLGQKVFEENDYQKSNYTKLLNLASLSRGMYILRVSTASQKAVKKIILN